MNLLNKDYSYSTLYFEGSAGLWKLIGSKGEGKAKDAVDTFKNQSTGEYRDMVRWKVANMEKHGKIKGIIKEK